MNELMTIAPPDDLKADVPILTTWAKSLVITTAEMFSDAGERLQKIKGMAKRWAELCKTPKQKIDEAKKALLDMEKMFSVPLAVAEGNVKAAMLNFQQAEQRKAEAEQRRLQAVIDAKAAAERAKLAEQQAAQKAIEDAARAKEAAARLAAEQASAEDRKRLLAEAEKAKRQADAAAVKQEVKAEAAAAVYAPVVAVAPATPKVAGQSVRTTWKCEVVNREAFFAWVCENKRFDLIQPNEKVLESLVRGLKEAFVIPGVRAFAEQSLASKGR